MTWSVSQISRNVHRIAFSDIAPGWEQWLLLRSDAHHDSSHCDRDYELSHLRKAQERDAPIVDVGDLFDAMQGREDRRRSASGTRREHFVDNYFDALLETAAADYAPYASQFALLGMGNHETAIIRHQQINLTHNLAARLRQAAGRPDRAFMGGYGGYIQLQFRMNTIRHGLNLKYYHGAGGGGVVTKGVINTNRDSVIYPDATFVVTGHVHEAWIVPLKREHLNAAGSLRTMPQYHICVPGYKDEYEDGYMGYHVERRRPPKMLGATWLHFTYEATRANRGIIQYNVIPDWK